MDRPSGVHDPDVSAVDAGRTPRLIGAVLLLSAIFVFAGAATWALTAPDLQFVWPLSMISDLGARDCFTADGRWICSPRATAFNAGLLTAGTALAGAAAVLHRVWGPALRSAVVAAAAGLIVLGLNPSDTTLSVHMVGAVLALPVSSALLMISGVRGERIAHIGTRDANRSGSPPILPVLRTLLAVVALLATLAHLFPQWRVQGAAELVSLIALFLVLLAETCALVYSARRPRVSGISSPDVENPATRHSNRRSARDIAASGSPRRRRSRSANA